MSYRWTVEDVMRKERARARAYGLSDNIASITPAGSRLPHPIPAERAGISQCGEESGIRKDRLRLEPRVNSSAAPSEQPVYAIVGMCRAAGLPEPVPEYAFAKPGRGWRADYAWPLQRLLLEVDGGIWTRGAHSTGTGRLRDMEKLSEAAIRGYRVIYATPDDVRSGAVMDRIQRALGAGPRAA